MTTEHAAVRATGEMPARWAVTGAEMADGAEIRALFERVFGLPMSEALWRWKYDQGRGCASLVRDVAQRPARLVAHYGGTRRTLRLGERSIEVVQMGDVMVDPSVRGILSRRGPFARSARHMIDACVGDARDFELGFGFPGGRHARLGALLGMYTIVGEVRELRWAARPARGWDMWRYRLAPFEDSADAWRLVDTLWQRMRRALAGWAVPQRDAAWCRHRYASHPHHGYRMMWLRSVLTGGALGLLVLRPGADTLDHGADWEWMDWVGPPAALALALQAARSAAARGGGAGVRAWLSTPVVDRMLREGAPPGDADTVACDFCITRRRAATVPEQPTLAPWWLTGGDTDFR